MIVAREGQEVEYPFDLSVTDRLLQTTRSVRRRLDFSRPVERSIVVECIRLAQQAPTASNTQFWRWLIIDEPHVRKEIARIYQKGAPALAQRIAETSVEGLQTRRVNASAAYLMEHFDEVPLLALPCLERRLPGDAPLVEQSSHFGSIIQSIWSFQLALRSRGLGSVYTTVHLLYEKEMADALHIPEDVTQIALLPVAYTKGTDFSPAVRPNPEKIIHWNRW